MSARSHARLCGAALLLAASLGQAQTITSDGSLGTTVTGSSPTYTITDGARPNNGANPGTNLFHSFSKFNVGAADTANFSNNSGLPTKNIVARITGGQSTISGKVQTSGFGGANLFLVDPAGFVFSGNASLNVGGSFTATTADYVVLDDGWRLGATIASGGPVLTVAGPTRFGFLGATVGDISVGAPLAVKTDQSLSFIGRAINVTGSTLKAPSGRIDIASVKSAGEVGIDTGLHATGFNALGDISMTNSTLVVDGNGSGDVFIKGGNFYLQSSAVSATTTGNIDGGVIQIATQTAHLTNSTISDDTNLGPANGGTVRFVDVGSVTLDHATIESNTHLAGNAGDVRFENVGTLDLLNGSTITATNNAGAKGGSVVADSVGTLRLSGNSEISVSSGFNTGSQAGSISLTASQSVQVADAGSHIRADSGGGVAGGIVISTPLLDVSGIIEAITTSTGAGTNTFDVTADRVNVNSGGRLSTATTGLANAGAMRITAGVLNIDGGEISSTTTGPGHGGSITIGAGTLGIANHGTLTASTLGGGEGGAVTVSGDAISIASQGSVSSDTELGPSRGGTVRFVDVKSLTLDGGAITSNTHLAGDAGELRFENVGRLDLLNSSKITAETNAGGVGGNVTAESIGSLTLSGSSEISVSSGFNTGSPAGKISITANDFIDVADGGSQIRANSGGGVAGGIVINTPLLDVSGAVEAITSSSGVGTSKFEITADQVNVRAGGLISTETLGIANAGTMHLASTLLNIAGGEVTSSTTGSGLGGSIAIDSTTLRITSGGKLTASTAGHGNGGSITVSASTVEIDQQGAVATDARPGGSPPGSGGKIRFVDVGSLTLDDGTITSSTDHAGDAGELRFENVGRMELRNGSKITAETSMGGRGGDVAIDTRAALVVSDGSEISVSSSPGTTTEAGTISVKANEAVNVTGSDSRIRASSGGGAAGEILINTPQLNVSGAVEAITTSTGHGTHNFEITATEVNLDSGGRISTLTEGTADAGSMHITSGTVSIDGGEITASTTAAGPGGGVGIDAGNVVMRHGGAITSSSTGKSSGNAGSIAIAVADSLRMEDSAITTAAEGSSGGNIAIDAGNLVYLLRSRVSASANGVTLGDDGGNVRIDPSFVIVNRGAIVASANAGNGGNISVTADTFIQSAESILDASSQTGIDGQVVIESPIQDVTAAVTIVDVSFLDTANLLRQRCSAAPDRERSFFAVAGKGGVRHAPDAYFPSVLQGFGLDLSAVERDAARDDRVAKIGAPIRFTGAELGCIGLY